MSAYFVPLVLIPVVIDSPGKYLTRCGETVEIVASSHRHDFGCHGHYANGVRESWHKSGRIFASQQTANDIVARC